MSGSTWKRIVSVLFVVMLGFTGLIVLIPAAQGATWTQTTDADFNAGTLNGVEVVGTGVPAFVRLVQDATDWRNENPASAPSAREGPAMAYDSTENVAVLFGGYSAGDLGDTWEYNLATNTWTQTSSTGPSARAYAGMAYDSASQRIILFGGASTAGGFLRDTWEYNAATNAWTETTPGTSPPAMASYPLAYHSQAQRTILAGMNIGTSTFETWAYDSGSATWQNRAPSSPPSARSNHATAYHANLNRIVLYGGAFLFTTFGDTHEYNYATNAWTMTIPGGSGPPARTSHGMSYRSSDVSVYLFGGTTGAPQSDTWRYFDVSGTRNWVMFPTQRSPPARTLFGFTNEAPNRKSVLFGGTLAGGAPAGDTWSLGPAFRGQGDLTSSVFDSGGANANWDTISWLPTSQPGGTTLRFQTATSNDPNPAGVWDFRGPDCQTTTYYTTSGTSICSTQDNRRYIRYRAQMLTSNNINTPTMDEVSIVYDVPPSAPYLVTTDPANAEFGVDRAKPIFVRFSESMNTSSVTWTISPSTTVTPSWSESNSALTLSHATPFQECKAYTVTITGGRDVAGNNLNNSLNLVPNPWSFVTQCVNPTITSTSPAQGTMDIPLNAPIIVNFSEPMDPATLNWTINPTIALTPTWSNGDQTVTLSHTADFPQCEMHMVQIFAKDLAGLSLVPGPVPNPWSFMSECTIPFIVDTNPFHLETGVAVNRPIIVNFSEPMDRPTVTWTIAPSITLTPTWSNMDKTLTLSHASPFSVCTTYEVDVAGKDLDGNDLFPGQHESHAPHPWKFSTVCPNPFLVLTIPAHGDTGVDQFADIFIQFSEPMNPGSVTWTITGNIPLTPNWMAGNQILTLAHTDPFVCTPTTVQIFGTDVDGNPLIAGPAPNPWTFTAVCPNPFIVSTNPANDATGVALTVPIVVTFSEPMNRASVVWSIAPPLTLTGAWSANDTVLTLSHAVPFSQSTQYTASILAGQDVDGNDLIPGPVPNPWRFTTVGVNPQILSTDPANGQTNVVTGANVIVRFSESMNTTSVTATANPAVSFTYAWQDNDTLLILGHILPFAECANYTVTVTGNDLNGDPLVPGPVPNPWFFLTVCFAPSITSTSPANGATGVARNAPIIVNFSEPMDRATVVVVTAPPVTLTYTWSNGDRTLTLTHAADFLECTTYTVTASGRDLDGNDLVPGPVPNPWSFQTVCAAPFIVSTVPANGTTNVPTSATVVVTFSRAMNRTTVVWTFNPAVTANGAWSGGDTVLTLTPTAALAECTLYQVLIQGSDTNGNALVPGPVPNPWTFRTVCTVGPPTGLRVARVAPDTVRLTWNPVVNADAYRVFSSVDRFAAFPWPVLGETGATTFDAVGHLNDGLTHYYIVRTLRSTVESTNSTMAVKIDMPVGFNAAGTNVRWLSLPYTTTYARASDIANELGNTRISVVAKWNPATQSSILYYYFRGAWRGTDFTINAGDGLWIGSVSAFNWVITGTDRAVTLSFTRNAAPLQNVNWVSLPYTSTYRRASDLVVDIEGSTGPGANTRIVEVVKWDPTTQSEIRYAWTPGGWSGTDFVLNPGDGIYFRIVSNFNWQPRLVTPEVP